MDLLPISIIGPRCPNNGPNYKKIINVSFHPRELLQLHQLRIKSWCSDSMEASPPFEDQSFRLALRTTTPDDEGTVAADGSKLPRGVHTMCWGCGGLLALVLRLPSGPGGVAGG